MNRLAGIGDEAGSGLAAQLAAITRLGWDAIELRTIDGVPVAELDDRAFQQSADTLAEAGVEVIAVDSRIAAWSRPATGPFEPDLAELETLGNRCAVLATPYVRVMSYPADTLPDSAWREIALHRMKTLARHAEDLGLVLLHENCAGWAGVSPARTLEMLDEVDSPALALLFDTGNGAAYGYEAYDFLEQVVGQVRHVHVKDVEEVAGAPVYRLPGQGRARVADCLRLLAEHGYSGALSIEPHLAVLPHEGRRADPDACATAFIAAGHALETLVRRRGADMQHPEPRLPEVAR